MQFEYIQAFEQNDIRMLDAAYVIARDYVAKSDAITDCAEMREVIARKIMVTAVGGEKSPVKLANEAIAFAHQFARMRRILDGSPPDRNNLD
jgi:hypothetical protein